MNIKVRNFYWLMSGWAFVYALPAIYLLAIGSNNRFDIPEIIHTWMHITPFFVVYLIHHYLQGPYLWDTNRRVAYWSSVVLVVACYIAWQWFTMPGSYLGQFINPRPPISIPPILKHHDVVPPEYRFLRSPFIGRVAIMVLMLGFDFGIVGYMRNIQARRQVMDMEREKLRMELDYLKYQLNPHFFMNTLNNIHALIDIDGEKAQRAIIDLSKLLRYAIYDSNVKSMPLNREIEFLELYVKLMKMRCNSNVDIKLNFPEETGKVQIPPLILICFIENAFKHGINNRKPSFLHVDLTLDRDKDHLMFLCSNSKHTINSVEQQHGIGMDNVQKRLRLLYGENYLLQINNNDKTFDVCLQIPTIQC